ncbi:MAG: ATP-binding cassette domain-containing protein, partial [Pseudomonadota bacterium]
MALLRLQSISVGFGGPALLSCADLAIERNERVCLLGRNGEGKSTLLRILAGSINAYDGEIVRQQGLVVAGLEQAVPQDQSGTVKSLVTAAVNESAETDEWQRDQRATTMLSRLELDGEVKFETLSGGLQRRAMLACALVQEPDILLLDEPTNHLDIESVEWLEKFLQGYRGTLVFISHDREFMQRLATRIVLLDRGQLSSWPGDYDAFLKHRAEALAAEEKRDAEFDRKLAREEVWIRQGIKARRTRNEGRVRDLKKMRQARAERRSLQGTAKIAAQSGEKSGKVVVDVERISYAFESHKVVHDFSLTVQRGDKIGIIGPNGAGKTTLVRLLLGELSPTSGKVILGTNIELAYFDQLRGQLNPEKTAQENIADGADNIVLNGRPKHVLSYLQDFLFSPARARAPISALSGGEKNRLLLARIFAKPSNLLVLDEPTNDLDIETLELLEEQILNYSGTVLLVSHDRTFIDNVVTSTLMFTERGEIVETVGGYREAQAWRVDEYDTHSPKTSNEPKSRRES